ncbi:MAG: hypothetical protein B6U69_00905 [Thermofilum sp. ex4484_15]|nr:MAG: hypothetical protein B6U69_00905 [Thermofilum sp. ex4484_15]
MKVKIVAIGNSYSSDDGLALVALRELRKVKLPKWVKLVEIGSDPLRILKEVKGCDKLIVLDAILTGRAPPGTLHKFKLSEVEELRKLTLHRLDIGTVTKLALLLTEDPPREVIILGLEPKRIGPGSSLSEEVLNGLRKLVKEVLREISTLSYG